MPTTRSTSTPGKLLRYLTLLFFVNHNMSTSREAPNPLRPYYIPPSIGVPPEAVNTTSAGTHRVGLKNGSAASYASSARDMFSDIDYSDYLSESSPGTLEQIRSLLDQALYKYTSVLLAQPFEVAKTILQVKSQAPADGKLPEAVVENVRQQPSSYRDSLYSDVCARNESLQITC